ncbi:hypothetical protein A0H81_09576 [Grifola frondosa]|uniref:Uncharacterized protein n=1 Tax=Grifola frondosa TaxID=5627 RepID=A0A1C7M0N8_GRIFR|nr:hypothetical protein A0H81_09576 [Grifola frondosa]
MSTCHLQRDDCERAVDKARDTVNRDRRLKLLTLLFCVFCILGLLPCRRLNNREFDNGSIVSLRHADDVLLAKLGYKSEFKREFSLIETIAFAFSIMGVIASVSSTMSFPLVSGGHVGMVFGNADKRGPLLLFGEARPAEICGPGQLDYRLGERNWPSHARLLYRLHVRPDDHYRALCWF